MEEALEKLNNVRSDMMEEVLDDNKLRPWNTKEWKENRKEVLGDECEWCGDSDDVLQIHHVSSSPQWGRIWIRASDIAFVSSDRYNPETTIDREECPNCSLRDYYERKTKSPTFRCSNCGEEFESPKTVKGKSAITEDKYDTKPYTTPEYLVEKADWVENNYSIVKQEFAKLFENKMEEYVEMNDVITICQSCHFKEEQTSMVRCSKCEETFHKRNNEYCWDCLVEEKGLERCGDCGEGWYNPDYNGACSDCRS